MDAPLKPGLMEQLVALQAEQSEKREVRSRRNSSAGPDLPLRFSQGSIASTRHSIDPFSVEELASTLTSPEFRQRVDKDRSFTGSAPPGARPPPARGAGASDLAYSGPGDERDGSGGRRATSAPVVRPPSASRGCDMLHSIRSLDELEESDGPPRSVRPPSASRASPNGRLG